MNIYSVLTAIIILRPEKLEQIEDKRQKKKKSWKITGQKILQINHCNKNPPIFLLLPPTIRLFIHDWIVKI